MKISKMIRPLAVIGLVSILGLTACDEPVETAVASEALLEIGADNVVFGMVAFMTSRGIRDGRVNADTAYMFADSASAQLHQMSIVFYNANGTARATVTGTSGDWDQQTDRMTARGDVVLLVHDDGRKIRVTLRPESESDLVGLGDGADARERFGYEGLCVPI